jgi:hypothetical protein
MRLFSYCASQFEKGRHCEARAYKHPLTSIPLKSRICRKRGDEVLKLGLLYLCRNDIVHQQQSETLNGSICYSRNAAVCLSKQGGNKFSFLERIWWPTENTWKVK